jgi:hypothetical protein
MSDADIIEQLKRHDAIIDKLNETIGAMDARVAKLHASLTSSEAARAKLRDVLKGIGCLDAFDPHGQCRVCRALAEDAKDEA